MKDTLLSEALRSRKIDTALGEGWASLRDHLVETPSEEMITGPWRSRNGTSPMASFTFCENYYTVSLVRYLQADGIQFGSLQRRFSGTFRIRRGHPVHRQDDRLFSAALNAVTDVPHLPSAG